MSDKLSEQDQARLHAKFVLPIIVDEMLRDEEPLDDIAEHAMNEILFGLYPDSALLCLALCARHIARETADLPISRALSCQADQIVEEYGPLWLANENDPDKMDEKTIRELLVNIPEDLESLRDLLEATLAGLEEDHSIAAILCDILSLQADYHRDMAEIELQALHLRPQDSAAADETRELVFSGSNIIPFPGHAKRRRQTITG